MIFMSGYADGASVDDLGGARFLPKPFTLKALAEAVKPLVTSPTLPEHFNRLDFFLALAKTGSSMEARMPIMAITTNSSIRVNALQSSFLSIFFIIMFRVVGLTGTPNRFGGPLVVQVTALPQVLCQRMVNTAPRKYP